MVFHLKKNGQTKIINQEIKRQLCISINYQQDDQSLKLVLVKFAANNNVLASTIFFFITKNLHS